MSDFEHIDDELVSAYLDDELTPEERAHVDARLAADPAARQLLEQLRNASQAMKTLPQESVGEDLRESILRRAETAMLSSNGGQLSTSHPAGSDDKASRPGSLPTITVGRTRRAWVWAGLAMAAALLIMFVERGDREAGDLSQLAASRHAEDANKLGVDDLGTVPELRAVPTSETASTPTESDFAAATPESPPSATPLATGEAATPPAGEIALDVMAPPAAPATSSSELRDSIAATDDYGTMTSRAPATVERFSEAESPLSPEGDRLAKAPADERRFGGQAAKSVGVDDSALAAGVSNGNAPAAPSAGERELAESVADDDAARKLERGPNATGQAAAGDSFFKARAKATDSDVLVVRLVVEPEVLRTKAFDQLLAKNGIEFEPIEEQAQTSAAAASRGERGGESAIDRKLDWADGARQDEGGRQVQSDSAEEVILVAAPRSAIVACLAELNRDQAHYVSVGIGRPAAGDANEKSEADKSLEELAEPVDVLAVDLGTRFNRGLVPPTDFKLRSDRYYSFSDVKAGPTTSPANSRGFGGGLGGGAPQQQLEQEQLRARTESMDLGLQRQEATKESTRGRARRLRFRDFDDQPARELSATGRKGAVGRRSSQQTGGQGAATPQRAQALADVAPVDARPSEQLQVLFVLTPAANPPATTAPSPPAQNRRE